MTVRILIPVCLFMACTQLSLRCPQVSAAEPGSSELLQRFSQVWNEQDWVQPRGPQKRGSIRRTGDAGWRTRMLALRELVSQRDQAVPMLLKTLQSGSTPERILAAQTLGYLAPSVPLAPLLQAAGHDTDAAVRLYAVDAIGMKGVANEQVDWSELQQNEKNRDVVKHIGYAKLRGGEPLIPDIVSTLNDWNVDAIDSAIMGQPAPDFELSAASGETIRLSQYRGKKSVVLVFIYGDT